MLTEPLVVSMTEHVNKAIGLLERSNAYEIFVVEKNEVRGLVTVRDILRVSDITSAKISSLMSQVPQLARNDTVSRAARIMTDHRARAVPVTEKGKLVGELTASSICDHMSRQGKLNLTATTVMTPDPTFVREDDPIAKARTIMIQKNIDHLPVLRSKEIAGMLTSDTIVFRMRPPESIGPESRVVEEQRRLGLKVSGLMTRDPAVSTPDADLSQVMEQMRRRRGTFSLVALWGELQGIITYRDCVKLLAEPAKEVLPITIVGLPDDPFEAEAAKAKFERVVKRLMRSFPDLLEARSVIKTSEKTGQRHRYEVQVELITARKRTSFSAWGWGLPEIYDELQDKMKRVTTKRPKQRKRRLD